MADRGAEDAGLLRAELVGPGDDGVGFGGRGDLALLVLLLRDLLVAGGEGLGAQDLDVVVELFVDGGPIREAGGDRVGLVGEADGDRLLRAVAGGLQAEHLVPAGVVVAGLHGLLEIAPAVAVHGAVEVHGGQAVLMGVHDIGDIGLVGDVGGALIVDDHVEVLAPVRVLEEFEERLGGLGRVVGDFDHGVHAGFDALLQDFFLRGVIVAAAAGDDEDAQGLLLGGERGGQAGEGGESEEGAEFHGVSGIKGARGSAGKRKTYFLGFGAGLGAANAFLVSAIAALASSSGMGWPSTKA